MAKTNVPAFPKNASHKSVRITAANTNSQGAGTIGTDIFLLASSGADDTYFDKIRFSPTATTPTSTTATVARIFISTLNTGTTSNADTSCIAEITLPSVPADNASNSASYIDVPLRFSLESGKHILITNHAAPAANTAWVAHSFAGNF